MDGIIAFNPAKFIGPSSGAINGNVGLGASCGSTTVQFNGEKITGNLVVTGTKPSSAGGAVTVSITGNSSTLAGDINALNALQTLLAGEAGTSIALGSAHGRPGEQRNVRRHGQRGVQDHRVVEQNHHRCDGTHNTVLDFASGNSSISVNGSTPTGSLSQLHARPRRLEFSYSPKRHSACRHRKHRFVDWSQCSLAGVHRDQQ